MNLKILLLFALLIYFVSNLLTNSISANESAPLWIEPHWCFECSCNAGAGSCYVVSYGGGEVYECQSGNYEGACTGGCSLRMWKTTDECPHHW